MQDAGLEVQHEENIRVHYAKTLAGWCRNLVDNWDDCVAEVGEGTARVWGLYMAGSRIAFERNDTQLHHVLATKTDDNGVSGFPLRPTGEARLASTGEHEGPDVRRARRRPRPAVAAPGPAHADRGPGVRVHRGAGRVGRAGRCPGQFQSRYYTVRSYAAGELVLDVVVHDEGLVTEWVALDDCVGSAVTILSRRAPSRCPPTPRG